jgi:hypothetical protein
MAFIKSLFFGFAALLLCSGMAARAQFGLYGTVTGTKFGSITCPKYATPCATSDGSVRPYGGTFGGQYDLRTFGPALLGVDLRGEFLTGNKRGDSSAAGKGILRHYAGLAGVRASFKTPIHILHPYVEVAGGIDRNNDVGLYTFTTTTLVTTGSPVTTTALTYDPAKYRNYGVVKGFAGLDIQILPNLDLRAIEIGVGEAFGSAERERNVSVTTNGITSTPPVITSQVFGGSTSGIQSISAGIVFHMSR